MSKYPPGPKRKFYEQMSTTTKTHVDLFSGIGGFALAARNCGIQTIAFCEIDSYCQQVLKKNFPGVRIESDIKKLKGKELPKAWLLTGGFPCQPYSVAGQQRGKDDDRALWPEIVRLLSEMVTEGKQPDWCVFENVAGIIAMELDTVLSDMESIGYTTWSLVIPACATDARHRRDRVWVIAYFTGNRIKSRKNTSGNILARQGGANQIKQWNRRWCKIDGSSCAVGNEKTLSNINSKRFKGRRETGGVRANENGKEMSPLCGSGDFRIWNPEPNVGRVVHGLPNGVDRIKGLGNAIVPQVAEEIIKAIIEVENELTR